MDSSPSTTSSASREQSLSDKVALVTGASRGIGAAIADQLGQLGATVIGTATSPAGADAIASRFAESGIKGTGVVLNVCDSGSIGDTLKTIQSQYASPQILVNNAGITKDNIVMRMKEDEWDDVIETNLTALYRLTKPCLRGMTKARWGRIINIGSVVGATGNLGQSNYCAAKAGMEGFTRSLAREIASRNITVNCVAPGFVATDMTQELPEEHREYLLKQIPLGRMGAPSDIAAAVAFLASEQAAYITGVTLPVNGGMYMN